MEAKRYKTEVYITLYPPEGVDRGIGNRAELIRTVLLDFVPYPGLCLRFEGNYPQQEVDQWSPLLKAASGPKGAFGRGFNVEIWPLNDVVYHTGRGMFQVNSYHELLTIEQLKAVEELMWRYHGFRQRYPSLRRSRQSL